MQMSFLENKPPHQALGWQADRASGLEQLASFVPRAGRSYAQTRNSDFGAGHHTNVSVLSPWLRHRLVLEEEVLRATLKHHSLASAEKFIQEVFWRAYFKGWMEQRPDVWRTYREGTETLIEQLDSDLDVKQAYEAAVSGSTGIDCFDWWARELVDTGYLHNHARMWFASIWIFTLRLPWQLGADFFLRHLLDGDPASNTLSWRWVGGLHTKGKHYLARPDNIERFTNGRFRPVGLVTDALPLVEDKEFSQVPLNSPQNVEIDEPFGLLITEEDMNGESLSFNGRPISVMGLLATDKRSSLDVGQLAKNFAADGMKDAVTRASDHYQCESHESVLNSPDSLSDWAHKNGFKTILTARPPVGPVQEELTAAQSQLRAEGIKLVVVERRYDQLCWPHANKGFFKLKKKIPQLVQDLLLE